MKLEYIFILLLIGIVAGFVSGLAGIGGGVVIVPLLVMLIGMTQHQAQGTSMGTLMLPVAAVAAYNYYKAGYVNWNYVIVLALAFVVGGYLGSKLAISLDQRLLKRVFATVLIISAIKIFYDSFK